MPDAEDAALIVLFDCDTAQRGRAVRGRRREVDTIDSTRKFASVSADGGEPLEGDVQAGLDRVATALSPPS